MGPLSQVDDSSFFKIDQRSLIVLLEVLEAKGCELSFPLAGVHEPVAELFFRGHQFSSVGELEIESSEPNYFSYELHFGRLFQGFCVDIDINELMELDLGEVHFYLVIERRIYDLQSCLEIFIIFLPDFCWLCDIYDQSKNL